MVFGSQTTFKLHVLPKIGRIFCPSLLRNQHVFLWCWSRCRGVLEVRKSSQARTLMIFFFKSTKSSIEVVFEVEDFVFGAINAGTRNWMLVTVYVIDADFERRWNFSKNDPDISVLKCHMCLGLNSETGIDVTNSHLPALVCSPRAVFHR